MKHQRFLQQLLEFNRHCNTAQSIGSFEAQGLLVIESLMILLKNERSPRAMRKDPTPTAPHKSAFSLQVQKLRS